MIQKTVHSLVEMQTLLKDGYKVVSIPYWEYDQYGYQYNLEKVIN